MFAGMLLHRLNRLAKLQPQEFLIRVHKNFVRSLVRQLTEQCGLANNAKVLIMKSTFHILLLTLVFGAALAHSQESDFSWVPDSPANKAETTLANGTVVTLSTDTVPFFRLGGFAQVFEGGNGSDVQITLEFSRPITTLSLQVGEIDIDDPGLETLQAFSTLPDSVDGSLILKDGVVTTIVDNGSGRLFWHQLNATSISFTYTHCTFCGMWLENFVISDIQLGDVNCDGTVDLLDVAPFVEAISTGQYNEKADVNQDGFVDLLDVAPFVGLLTGG